MPTIVFKNVTLRYGTFEAVKKLNFTINDGEYIGILGPSGCGKTTTLKLIAGLRKPSEGEIWIDRKLVNDVPPEKRDVGLVFQHYAIFPFMNVWENVTYGPRIKGWSEIKIEKAGWDALELVKLTDKVDAYPSELSAPELQRVGIARAIATGAKILLLDEPLSTLDPKVRQVFRYEIRRLVKKLGLTAIHVTHDQEEATSVSDRIIVMRAGRIVQIGHPYELYVSPKSLFVANFIGESVFLVGYVKELSEDIATIELRGGLTIEALTKKFSRGDKVVIAVRKEKFNIGQEDGENTLTGVVIQNRYLGFFSRIRVRLPSQEIIEIKVSPENGRKVVLNKEITLTFRKEDVLVYPYPKEGLEKAISVV